jgi:apolipoprotein D and lipocalin family protein
MNSINPVATSAVFPLTCHENGGGVNRFLLALGLLVAIPAQAVDVPPPPPPLAAINSLDLARYMGPWTEIARYPNRFQKQCTGPAVATYSLLPEGTVRVVNRCPQADGKVDEAIGEARRVGPPGSARLQVRFAPAWLSWLPQVWGSYWVVELDEAYQLAVVSEPTREYLWVLSRQPSLSPAAWSALTWRLTALGFDPARLLRTAGQSGP